MECKDCEYDSEYCYACKTGIDIELTIKTPSCFRCNIPMTQTHFPNDILSIVYQCPICKLWVTQKEYQLYQEVGKQLQAEHDKHWFAENKPIELYRKERKEIELIIFNFIDKIYNKCLKVLKKII